MALELLFMMGNLSTTGGAFELLGELRTLLSAFSWFSIGCSTFNWVSWCKPTTGAAAAAAGEETDERGEGDGAALEPFTDDFRPASASRFLSKGFSAACGGCLWYDFSSSYGWSYQNN
jgi:hypothetical protein